MIILAIFKIILKIILYIKNLFGYILTFIQKLHRTTILLQ